ncbi:HesA/MoeB/ThiF family protein [Paraflavisolibacter sp. H34]|uniref:HesA/MoeB/ThiF family protein n=1 Tax=Huijunlia imazamoxiresistens TaxID=3127457 RepID=UPI0030195DBC
MTSFSEIEQQRYSRHLMLEGFGPQAQEKLKKARVLVIGAGGLGCPVLLYLAAAGVGHLGIMDDDTVALSNLQRQVLFSVADTGRPKAQAARDRLLQLNDQIGITALTERIHPGNALALIKDYDLVVDGSDNFATRYLLNDACVLLDRPLVYGAIFKFTGQVSVFNWKGGPTYRCLFPEPPAEGEMPACGEIGVLGVLPGIIGCWQATEAIKVLTGTGEPLSGQLLQFDLLTNNVHSFAFEGDAANRQLSGLGTYHHACTVAPDEVDGATLRHWLEQEPLQLLDVREAAEYAARNIGGRLLPLSELEQRLHEIDPLKRTVVHCQSGTRSRKALNIIRKQYPHINIYNLKGGLATY